MTHAEVLRDARGYAEANRIVLRRHARKRQGERRASYDDIRHALSTATQCVDGNEPDTWCIVSTDLDGDALTVFIAFDDGVVVVTVK